ncbi:MAG: hypothetical protein E5W56_10400 [Mesorhizobium sp.]|nr:MAG: hypothetical protein E5W56_10400 [Mesorhizobium sp.]
MTVHKGGCFCGAVEIEVHGSAEAMGYCHCSSCRSWSALPMKDGLPKLKDFPAELGGSGVSVPE